MRYKDFLSYLEENLDGYSTFAEKALAYQEEKNQKRPKKTRWEDDKVHKAAHDMWVKSMQALYDTLRKEIKSNDDWMWMDYIKNHEILDMLNESISELEFNGQE